MKLAAYIAALQKIADEHGGDLEVVTNGGSGPFKKAPLPRVRYRMTGPSSFGGLVSGGRNYFHIAGRDLDRTRGDKVVST